MLAVSTISGKITELLCPWSSHQEQSLVPLRFPSAQVQRCWELGRKAEQQELGGG